ncbi:TPA: class II aldolase/adducin family protein [Pseudomonas aeruginosa]|nr:class II aldolase/adducin family protein [Pseudomonas aeruginosa]
MLNHSCQAHGSAAFANDSGHIGITPDPALVEDLVRANHILFDQGIVDAFGHVSVRHDKDPERFLLARNMAPGTVRPEDIVQFTLDGAPVDAGGRSISSVLSMQRFIGCALTCRRLSIAIHLQSCRLVSRVLLRCDRYAT